MIPGVVYGAKEAAMAVELDPKQITRILHSESGHNTIFDLEIGGAAPARRTKAMIVDWQYEPIKGKLMHIDLKRIAMDKAMRVKVPVIARWNSGRRQDAGRHSRSGIARGGDRVPAGRYPEPH